MSRWRWLLPVMGAVAYAALSWWMMRFYATRPWAVFVLLGPLWLAAVGLAASCFGRLGAVLVALAGLGLGALVWRGEAGDPHRLYVIEHVAVNLLLCGWFGSSLRAGRLSLIGSFAERVHPLTPDHVVYTGQVTRVWTLYFALVAACSVAVFTLFSFDAWSWFSNVISPLCFGLLFATEYLLRYRLHPEFERASLADAVRAVQGFRADGPGRAAASVPAVPAVPSARNPVADPAARS